ncbi:MAG TPA: PIN domain-containing protein [Terriglobia bacterium]|nr:PIN domain-containing protein [Terriglobia bacterium]
MRLVADANVLLSAVLGGRAKLVLGHPDITEVLTAGETLGEVQEYAGSLARKKRLAEDLVLLAVAALPVTVVEREAYVASISEASRRVGKRDPKDVEILALAIALRVPLWSNDKDFEGTGVEWYSTEDLLRRLGIIERH